MKKMTRALALVLTVCMMLSSVVFAGAYSDVTTDNKYYSPVSLLSALGIIKGYEDGTFGPDRDVTRAEFTVMLMRTMKYDGLGSTELSGLPFTDVESVKDWAVGDIRTAYDLGVINGTSATTFEPNANVTYEQALKMIVCSLGYYPAALDAVGGDATQIWPKGYIQVATQLALTTGIAGAGAVNSKRWEIATMLYNALEVDVMESTTSVTGEVRYVIREGKNFLYDKLHIAYATGELLADEKTTISADGKLALKGEAVLLDRTKTTPEEFKVGTVSTAGLVGHSVKYYYNEDGSDGTKTLVYIEDRLKGDVLTIPVEDIDGVTGSLSTGFVIEYMPSADARQTKKVKTVSGSDLIVTVNGRLADNVTADTLWPEAGELKLMSTSGDDYDKVSITAYETYVVKTRNLITYTITDQYKPQSAGNELTLDPNNTSRVVTLRRKDGTVLDFNSIQIWDVLTVKRSGASGNRVALDVEVTTQSVSGKITSVSTTDGTIKIDGKEFWFSNYFLTYNADVADNLSVGDSSTFYLDNNGDIAAMQQAVSASSSYGYIAYVTENSSKRVEFAFLPQGGSRPGSPVYVGAKKMKIDGESYSDAGTIVDVLTESAQSEDINPDRATATNITGSQLVRYSLNAAGEIDSLDTLVDAAVPKEDDLAFYPTFTPGATYTYRSGSMILESGSSIITLDSNTIVFTVPSNRQDYNKYTKTGTSYFSNAKNYRFVEAYGTSTGQIKMAKAIVVYAEESDTFLNYKDPVAVVKSISRISDQETGEVYYELVVYQVGGSKGLTGKDTTTLRTESDNDLQGTKVGDVIRYKLVDGKIADYETDGRKSNFEIVFSPSAQTGSNETKSTEMYTTGTPYYTAVSGLLASADTTAERQNFSVALANTFEEIPDEVQIPYFTTTNVAYFQYDSKQGTDNTKLTAGYGKDNMLDLTSFDSYASKKDSSTPNATRMFVYTYQGNVKLIYVVAQ